MSLWTCYSVTVSQGWLPVAALSLPLGLPQLGLLRKSSRIASHRIAWHAGRAWQSMAGQGMAGQGGNKVAVTLPLSQMMEWRRAKQVLTPGQPGARLGR